MHQFVYANSLNCRPPSVYVLTITHILPLADFDTILAALEEENVFVRLSGDATAYSNLIVD